VPFNRGEDAGPARRNLALPVALTMFAGVTATLDAKSGPIRPAMEVPPAI
jgi:hypothetical protein